jgi:D-alanyl-D-alanine carboxypeptidase
LIGAKRSQQRSLRGTRPQRLSIAPSPADEIPEARRVVALRPARPLWRQRLLFAAAGSGLVAVALALVFQQPLRRWLAPPPVAGLNARLSADGRLLGHFAFAEATSADLVTIAPGLKLHREAAEALLAMQRAAAADGVDLVVLSAFRSIELQKQLFFDVKSERAQSARQRARVSAPPGFSEHSTGYAVDLGDGRAPATNLSPEFAATPAFRWLQAHAARHHFVLSFPENNPQGVSYEPWHWRFEGTAEALQTFEPAQRLQP